MREFSLTLTNRPGQLAALARQFADAGINIETLAGVAVGGDSIIRFMVDDPTGARRVLQESGLNYDERQVLDTFLPNRPGALADMTEDLADAGVNIDAIYLLHSNAEGLHFAVTVDDPATAAGRLGPA